MSEKMEIKAEDDTQERSGGSNSVVESTGVAKGDMNGVRPAVKEEALSSPYNSAASDALKNESLSSARYCKEENVDLARNGKEVQPTKSQKKKRRIIDDEDESDDQNASIVGKLKSSSVLEKLDSESNNDASDDGKDSAPSNRTTRSTRIRNASAKNRPTIHDDEDVKNIPRPPTQRPTPSSHAPVDKPTKQCDFIPKKKVPRRTIADGSAEASTKSSLLAHMEQPPAATFARPLADAPSKQPNARVGVTGSAASQAKPTIKTEPKSQAKLHSVSAEDASAVKELKLQNFLAAQAKLTLPSMPSLEAAPSVGNVGRSESVVMQDLQEVCNRCSDNINFRLPPTSPSNKVDLSGSFLDDDRYDFFDTNERGEIVIAPRQPIFPEEFPRGMKEHNLSWWGILDPAFGDGKYSAAAAIPDPRNTVWNGQGSNNSRHPPPSELQLPAQAQLSPERKGGEAWGRGPGRNEGPRFAQDGTYPGRVGEGWGRTSRQEEGARGDEARFRGLGRGGDGWRPYDGPNIGPPPDSWNGTGRTPPYGAPRSNSRR